MDKPLLDGKVYEKEYDGWLISWESDRNYRFWCRQHKINNKYDKDILVVMFNPGSLGGRGERLSSDTTLGILRQVFQHIPFNCFVTNLFDYCLAKPYILISEKWDERDMNSKLIYQVLNYNNILAYLMAYGQYEYHRNEYITADIKNRIKLIRQYLSHLPEIPYIRNKQTPTPKHPYAWRTENLVLDVRNNILKTIIKINKVN